MERNVTSWRSEEHSSASTWKCADPNCNEVNYGEEEESCVKCNLSREKSDLLRQKLQVFREFAAKKPTDSKSFKRIDGTKAHSIAASKDIGRSVSEYNPKEVRLTNRGRGKCIDDTAVRIKSRENIPGDKVKACSVNGARGEAGQVKTILSESKLNAPKDELPAQHVKNQSVNHRLSSIVHKYSSVMVSRGERQKKVDGVKYVLQVCLKSEFDNMTKALGKVMQKVGSNSQAENRKKCLKSLEVELVQTLKAVDWTRLASVYHEASALASDDCGKSKMTDAEVLETVTSDYNKCNKIDRRVDRFKKYLNRIVNTLENIKMGSGSTSVPDVEEAIRKLEECLEYPVLNMDDQMVLWSTFKIEEILDDVIEAWSVLQSDGDCEVKMKLKQMENPLVMFGSKYCSYNITEMKSEDTIKDHESLGDSKLGEKFQWEEKQDLKLIEDTDETPVQSAIVVSTKPIKWSTTELRKNTSTPNSTVLVEESEYLDTIQTEEEPNGFYDSSYEDCNDFASLKAEIVRDDFDRSKEETASDEADSRNEEIACDEFEIPKEDIANHSFSHAKPIKNTDAGYMKVEEIKKLIETYTNQQSSPQVDNFLNSLDRDQDGWVLFEDFEAGLTSALLGCG